MLATMAGVCVPALLIGPYLARESLRHDEQARIHALMTQYGSVLTAALVQPIWLADPQSAEGLLHSVMANPDVVAITVEDASLGAFLAKSKPEQVNDVLVRQMFPVVKDGNTIGTLTVTMTTRHVRGHLFVQSAKVSLALAFQLMLTLVILFVVFNRRLFRPVQALVDALRRMAAGDLTTSIKGSGNGDELCALAVGMDEMRSQLARTLSDMRALNAELEQRVLERTRDLQSALIDLERAHDELERTERMAALGAMVAGISHELNTPIGNALTVSSTLVDRVKEFQQLAETRLTRAQLQAFTDAAGQASALVQRNLEKAAQLIVSFKQVAVDRTVAHRREFNLETVIQEVLLTLTAVMKRKGYVIECQTEPNIRVDGYPGQLGQVLTNIVQNADVHGLDGREDGRILVSARKVGADRVELRVEDNGRGILPEHRGRVFDPFFTTRLGQGGSGLGLNIVHNLVCNLMGGDIRVESEVGRGTCFIIELPRVAPVAAEGGAD